MYASKPWPLQLSESLQSVDDLLREGVVDVQEAALLRRVEASYQIQIPRYYIGLMDLSAQGREACPIRRQAVPCVHEHEPVLPSFLQEWSMQVYQRPVLWMSDPIGDVDKKVVPRLTHRYQHRVLLHTSSVCAMYCRYCFRKNHLQNQERALYGGSFEPALVYIREHTSVHEVVLTGGDPLSLPDKTLGKLLDALDAIPHVRHIRIHTRMPVTLPARITQECVKVLSERRCVVGVVAHFNHIQECTPQALDALSLMRKSGVVLYNQSVLLKGVNNEVGVLASLFQCLYEQGVRPFYMHHPDWTEGTSYFRVSIKEGQALMRSLQGFVSGPALPSYVLDVPSAYGKVPLMGQDVQCVQEREEDGWYGALYSLMLPHTLAGFEGQRVRYVDAVCRG
jgi:lysine 2,3-aminomutase